MPQFVQEVLEHLTVLLAGRIKAHLVHDLGKRHLDVKVILVDRVLEPRRRPVEIFVQVALDDLAVRTKLGGSAVRNADHLSRPTTTDLVLESDARKSARGYVLGVHARGYECDTQGQGGQADTHCWIPPIKVGPYHFHASFVNACLKP